MEQQAGVKETSDKAWKGIRPVRSRKNRPCDNCRSKRLRCVIEQVGAACELCRNGGKSCTFLMPPRKRYDDPGEGSPKRRRTPQQQQQPDLSDTAASHVSLQHNILPTLSAGSSVTYDKGRTTQHDRNISQLDEAYRSRQSSHC